MKFINLTPHPVTLANGDIRITFEKDPAVPVVRVHQNVVQSTMSYEVAPGVNISLPLESHTSYHVKNLPDPQEGIIYIVSNMVAARVKRVDVVSPLTDATCERGEDGRVLSVRGFMTYTPEYGVEEQDTSMPSEVLGAHFEQFFKAVEETIEEVAPAIEEEEEEVLPPREFTIMLPKVDPVALDPIAAAAREAINAKKLKAKAKYEKRMGRKK